MIIYDPAFASIKSIITHTSESTNHTMIKLQRDLVTIENRLAYNSLETQRKTTEPSFVPLHGMFVEPCTPMDAFIEELAKHVIQTRHAY